MTTIRSGERRGLRRLMDRWIRRGQPPSDEIAVMQVDGLDAHLMRDIGLSMHSERYPRRSIRRP